MSEALTEEEAAGEETAFPPLTPWAGFAPGYRGAVILPVDQAGRVLLQLRDHNPAAVHPGEWGLFGGEAEPGETLAEAAAREFEEETGLVYPPETFQPFGRVVSPPSGRRLFIFEARLDIAPKDIRLGEGAGFGFIEARDFSKLDLVPVARIALDEWLRRQRTGGSSARTMPTSL